MKHLIFCLLLALLTNQVSASENHHQRVAILISGYAEQGGSDLSYDLEELAQSYLVLNRNGIHIDIVSPNGGSVLVKKNKDNLQFIKDFKSTTPALVQLSNTLSAGDAQKNNYDGLFIIGGDGAMFDLPKHPETQKFVQSFVDNNLTIVSVCHGPAALVNIKQSDGSYFVANKRITSFTAKEDVTFKKEHVSKYPFILQEKLESRGAKFESNSPMLPYVTVDENLITAQNPMSVADAAEALLLKIGITPKPRKAFKDEATMKLISRAKVEGDFQIDLALASNSADYDLNYLALYGFYAFSLADTKAEQIKELELMARIGKHVDHPQYQMALILAFLDMGGLARAKKQYQLLLQKHPNAKLPESIKEKLYLNTESS